MASVSASWFLAAGLLAAQPVLAADPALIERGDYLARAGDCVACHTAPGGQPFAGGLPIETPFGSIYPPNLTPDKATGIGDWTDEEFYHAVHDGVGRGGRNLYPALPYQWYTKVTREDVTAIRAYLASLPAVNAPAHKNTMIFPFNVRAGLAAWNAAFFRPGEFVPDPAKSEQLNRGAYLVEGLGHCGDCHTPKGVSKAPIDSKGYAGGMIDNWYAPNITSDVARGIGAWSEDELVQYLRTGATAGRGAAVGPMAQVVHDSLSTLTETDVRAIAAYLKQIPPVTDYVEARPAGLTGPTALGSDVYLTNCASCHQLNGQGQAGIPALDGNGAVQAKGPENVIRVVLGGHYAEGAYAMMPAVGMDMTDAEVAEVTNYVRTAWSNAAPATAEAGTVGTIRDKTRTLMGAADPQACRGEDAAEIKPIADPNHALAPLLAGINESNMSLRVNQLVARTRQIAPGLAPAALVNGLTLAYCPTIMHDGLQPAERRLLITRFGQLVFTQLIAGQAH